jgi:ribonucleoside-triphosphate reductase
MTDKEVRQFAQMLIYEFSQISATRGGQALYTDIHLYYEMPLHWAGLPAIGAAGKLTGKTYGDYEYDAKRFTRAIMEVFNTGDATGKPFILPRPMLHITDEFWKSEGAADFLQQACDVASGKGNTCFVFDRAEDAQSFACDAAFRRDAKAVGELDKPWLMRSAAIQSVTLNLPRLGYKAKGDEAKLFTLLTDITSVAMKAHIQKRDFIEKLLSYAEDGPLAVLAMNNDGFPFLRMNRSFYIIGIIGVNELAQIQAGSQLHQAKESLEFGLKIVKFLHSEVQRLSNELGIKIILEQSPAETTAYRFARLDLKAYSPAAGRYIKGDVTEGAIYYTNSTHLNVSADIEPLHRAIQEGLFHQYLEGEVITHLQLGGTSPGKGVLSKFIYDVFYNSINRQISFAPEFTSCLSCGKTVPGLNENCLYCGSADVEGIARLTKYYSKISSWNKSKLAELKNRKASKEF